MALINVSFDTLTKAMTATLDGAAVPDVVGCMIYQSYSDEGEYRCELTQMRKDEENDLMVLTTVVASADGTLSPKPSPEAAASALAAEIESYFRREGE